MLTVGLTGNIASGKSSVVRVWRSLGAHVVDADELARRVVEPGTPGLSAIRERWGSAVIGPDGRLDRPALRQIVFSRPDEKAALEEIIHPAVAHLREEEHRAAEASGAAVVVSDIPLLFEVGMQDDFDCVVLVDAPDEVRKERLMRDRGLAPEAAEQMMAAQMPADAKRSRADYVIDNSGTLADLERAARVVWDELLEESGK